ncbi:hypothetical protein KIW84_040570 [Lathyrus oleraceus]|uniref:Uncharacterized protein n=1 Tax=Pisum sativum TaxID=3888 RepID=A0A9D4XAD5_PEA|nr:hypothetical protein KIW84_040570 [Pisum sativum]
MMGVKTVISHSRYLGLFVVLGRSKKEVFSIVVDHLWKKMNVWKEMFLLRVKKEILIKAVAQAIPSYIMSYFKIPEGVCKDIKALMPKFWWSPIMVNKSAGPFDALLCVGQFFPDSPELLDDFMSYIEGGSHIPLPTYFIGDYGVAAPKVLMAATKDSANRGFKMDGFKVCDNLYWLKGSGKFNLFGLSVTYLSGRKSSNVQQFGTFSEDDVDALRAIAEEPGVVDLFLTYPSASDIPAGFSESSGSDSTISELVQEIKPRYHIAGSKGIYYAREPYSNVDAVHITRFIGLASVGNRDKQVWLFFFSILLSDIDLI